MDIFGLIICLFCLVLGFEIGREMGYREAVSELDELWGKIRDAIKNVTGHDFEIVTLEEGKDNDR